MTPRPLAPRRGTAFLASRPLRAFLAAFALLGGGALAASVAYTYDDAGRLVQAAYTDGAQTVVVQYAYDAAGNLVSVTQH